MYKGIRNVRVFAENNGNHHGFNVYLDFSGQTEFLMFHRHSGMLYQLLHGGIRVEHLARCARIRRKSCNPADQKLAESVSFLMRVIDDFIDYEYAAETTAPWNVPPFVLDDAEAVISA